MFVKHLREIEKHELSGEGIKNVIKQIPVGSTEGWKDHTLRVFTLRAGGHTPKHSHDWEHVNYVISGSGTLEIEGKHQRLDAGAFAFVPPNIEHQYRNEGKEDFVMICIVPSHGDY
jgi:quercetin dioxygenase-like cupin family protein